MNPKNFTREQAIEIWEAQDWCCAGCGVRVGDYDNMYSIHHVVFKSQMTNRHLLDGRVRTSNGVGLCPVCDGGAHGRNIV